eukprot:2674027-Pyramimonas_sp.AAC.1
MRHARAQLRDASRIAHARCRARGGARARGRTGERAGGRANARWQAGALHRSDAARVRHVFSHSVPC